MMKKAIVSLIVIGTFILYSFFIHNHSAPVAIIPNTTPGTRSSSSSVTDSNQAPTAIIPISTSIAPGSTAKGDANYRDGSYTGNAADAQWGFIQVKVLIKHGKITTIQFLQFPQDRDESVTINSYADPELSSEAIQAQSANVDIVTGATDSSKAFIQSLTNALSQAQG